MFDVTRSCHRLRRHARLEHGRNAGRRARSALHVRAAALDVAATGQAAQEIDLIGKDYGDAGYDSEDEVYSDSESDYDSEARRPVFCCGASLCLQYALASWQSGIVNLLPLRPVRLSKVAEARLCTKATGLATGVATSMAILLLRARPHDH